MEAVLIIDLLFVGLFGFYIAQAVSSSRHDKDAERKTLQPARRPMMFYTVTSNESVYWIVFQKTPSIKSAPPQKIDFRIRVVDKTNGLLQ